jgi:hypothetical protein
MRGRVREGAFRSHAVCPDGPRDVFERLLAHVFESEVEAARRIFLNARGDTDTARLGEAFEAGRDIDAVSEDVAVLDDDVALVNADAEFDAMLRRHRGIAFGHTSLDLSRATQRTDDTRKLDEQTVAGGLDEAAAMSGDLRVDHLGAERLQPAEGPFFVRFDKARIAGDVSRKDRCQPAFCVRWLLRLHGASPVSDDCTPAGARRALSKT